MWGGQVWNNFEKLAFISKSTAIPPTLGAFYKDLNEKQSESMVLFLMSIRFEISIEANQIKKKLCINMDK